MNKYSTTANIQAAKDLIKRYKEITLEDIIGAESKPLAKDSFDFERWGTRTAAKLTGFGSKQTCPLCLSVNVNCDICIHNGICTIGITYTSIKMADKPEQLLQAFKARANYIKSILNEDN
jgi:hypothetical protein